jgi:hypothetical protein
MTLATYRQRNAWVWAAQGAARDQCDIRILDPLPYLCHDGRCYGSTRGQPLYHDDNHLGETGNKLLVPMFAEYSNMGRAPRRAPEDGPDGATGAPCAARLMWAQDARRRINSMPSPSETRASDAGSGTGAPSTRNNPVSAVLAVSD